MNTPQQIIQALIEAGTKAGVSLTTTTQQGPPSDDNPNCDGLVNPFFRVLGFDRDRYFIWCYQRRQLLPYTKSDFTDTGFMALADLSWWETNYRAKSGFNKKLATRALIGEAIKRGPFDPDCVRGRGAWFDDERLIFHYGGCLFVDGVRTDLMKIQSRYLYEARPDLFNQNEEELTNEKGQDILAVMRLWRWETSAAPILAAGWIVLAPFCGALNWRPHLWVTGGSATGKSTFMAKVVNPLLGRLAVFAISNSTEAGIRQQLGCDARPVIFDEAEGGDDGADNRMRNIIGLMRQASSDTGARIFKGTTHGKALHFSCGSMFCLSSIRAALSDQADQNRISVLSLLPLNNSPDADEATLRKIDSVVPNDRIGAQLFGRTLKLLHVIQRNIQTFTRAAARRLATRRDADQIGTLVAGAWSLTSKELVTEDAAGRYLDEMKFGEFQEGPLIREGEKVLQTILQKRVRDDANQEIVVAELIAAAAGKGLLNRVAEVADQTAQRHGLRVMQRDGVFKLLVATNHDEVKALAKGSGFEADPCRQLARIKGARKSKAGEQYEKERFAANICRYIEIPIECALGDDWDALPATQVSVGPSDTGEQEFLKRHPRASRPN